MHVDAAVADVISGSPNAPLRLGPEAAVIEAAVALAVAKESLVVIQKSPPLIVGGYNVLSVVHGSKNPWPALYRTRAADVAWTPVYARPEERIDDALDRMRSAGQYNALVMEGDSISGLLTTLDLMRFLHGTGALRGIAPRGSAAIAADPDTSLGGAIHVMMGRGIRRLLLSGTEFSVSDHSLMRGALDGGLLLRLRDDPEKALSDPVTRYGYVLERPVVLPEGADAQEAAELILRAEDRVAVTEDRGTILTPWDLSVRSLLGSR
ncbi:CBS domain-containing protein [Conexivisphaera calida]|uniref:CBS domain-containing protein n=1 Tax=Conexivisphaera calida TaxID=1874277 RepID=A0A4P2VFX3_9ARCH|nr:CBS domain-containing protein [Conexivisphaera calida]BBE42192.1 hypothetical protein NAS2_0803 [Conexivisphaera calida]